LELALNFADSKTTDFFASPTKDIIESKIQILQHWMKVKFCAKQQQISRPLVKEKKKVLKTNYFS
jgi:uncharacterized protein YgiM (DUF1202 family)